MEENNRMYAFKQVEIRLKLKETDPLYSPNPIDSAEKAVKLLAEFMKDMDRECVYVINCDTKMNPISYSMAAMGGINYASLDPGNIYKSAMLSNASNVMILHVHPSGNNTPSRADVEMTQRTALAGAVLGIALQDHLIVAGGTGEFLSMRNIMPEIFTDPSRIAENRESVIKGLNMTVAEPAAAAQPQPTGVYDEVMMIMQRQQELMNNSPGAWKLAGDVADIAYASNGMQVNPREFETVMFMVDTADRIKDHDVDGIKSTLNEIAEASQDIALVRKTFQLIIRISNYDGEWEPASEKAVQAFKDNAQVPANSQGKAVKYQPEQTSGSFGSKLEAMSRKAEAINNERATLQAQQRPVTQTL